MERTNIIFRVAADVALQLGQIEEVEQAVKEAEAGDFASDAQVRAAFADLQQ